jgi:hypothetical protein
MFSREATRVRVEWAPLIEFTATHGDRTMSEASRPGLMPGRVAPVVPAERGP